eukprot:gene15038-20235_t
MDSNSLSIQLLQQQIMFLQNQSSYLQEQLGKVKSSLSTKDGDTVAFCPNCPHCRLNAKASSLIHSNTSEASHLVILAENKESKKKKVVDPNKPKVPPSSYQIFYSEYTPTFKDQNPSLSFREITSEVAKIWKLLPKDEREDYNQRAAVLRDDYNLKLAEYQRSFISEQLIQSLTIPPLPPKVAENSDSEKRKIDAVASTVATASIDEEVVIITSSNEIEKLKATSKRTKSNK